MQDLHNCYASLAGLVLFYCMFCFTCDRSFRDKMHQIQHPHSAHPDPVAGTWGREWEWKWTRGKGSGMLQNPSDQAGTD